MEMKTGKAKEIKSVAQLADLYYEKHPDGHYFDKKTLEFFGERMSDMRLLKGTEMVTDCLGKTHECYVINRVQRRCPGGMVIRKRAYFDVNTLDDVCL